MAGIEGQVDLAREIGLYVNNVVVQYVEIVDAGIKAVGTGACDFFVKGQRITGTWSKAALDAPTYYYLENGAIITLETGRTWIALHPAEAAIEVSK